MLDATRTVAGTGVVVPAAPIRTSVRWYMYAPESVNFDIVVAGWNGAPSSAHATDSVGPPLGVPCAVRASTDRNLPERWTK